MSTMRNDDFRRLVSSTPVGQSNVSPSTKAPVLGAKRSSFVPMTPRPGKASSTNDFARQVREQHASLKPTKKFKSSAPKGSKFAAGYTDRAKARQETEQDDGEDDKAKRIKALEEQVKLGQLDAGTFESLRDQILGGDISNTHMVKGLDRKLLERVRRGEDVFGQNASKSEEIAADVDEELDKLEEQEVEAVTRQKAEKKGNMAPPPIAGVKRTRDEIMAELKAQRKAAAEAKAASSLSFDTRWKKVGEQSKPKIEIDHKGREVLITVDKDGNVKKKVRKTQMDMPDAAKPVLGADIAVPELGPSKPDEEDEDIFADVGTEYNPLGDEEEENDDEDDDDDDDKDDNSDGDNDNDNDNVNARAARAKANDSPDIASFTANETQEAEKTSKARRNYFNENTDSVETAEQNRFQGIENVLKKAAQLDSSTLANDGGLDGESKEEREARLAKRAKMLQPDRDFEDMDMGFGSSRFEDEEEGGDGTKTRLSQWKGGAADEGWEADEKGSSKRKRKPKKRKGDVNNAADIMRVIEGRRAGASR